MSSKILSKESSEILTLLSKSMSHSPPCCNRIICVVYWKKVVEVAMAIYTVDTTIIQRTEKSWWIIILFVSFKICVSNLFLVCYIIA